MRSLRWLIVAVIILLVAGCSSSSEPMAVEFRHAGLGPTSVSGAAVDEGIVCENGSWTRLRMENEDGELVTDEEGARLWDEALESGATLHMMLHDEFNCSDGSGALSVLHDNPVTPATLDYEGVNDVGTWEIQGGTGDYEGYSGSGSVQANFSNGDVIYTGEIEEG